MTPGIRTHKHGSGQTAPYWVLSSECVVVVVGNYKFADGFTRSLPLDMHLRFRDTRRSHVAPRPPIVICRGLFANELPMPRVTLDDSAVVERLFSSAAGCAIFSPSGWLAEPAVHRFDAAFR